MTELPVGVGWTSLLTAYGRAQESRAADPLFVEPLAEKFVTAALSAPAPPGADLPALGPARDDGSSETWNGLGFYFAQRTPFYDRHVLDAVRAGVRQVVVVGAGLDTRAYRLGLPADVTVFELDTEPVLSFKAQVLADEGALPSCRRVPLVADLQGDWAGTLPAGGFDRDEPALWVVEGLLMYLDQDEADRLQSTITDLSVAGSRVAGEYFNRPPTRADVGYETLDADEQATWDLLLTAFRPNDLGEPADWLARHGWRADEVTDVVTEARRAGRPVPELFSRSQGSFLVRLYAGSRT